MAPGTTTMTRLSMISMTAIENVSDASAIGITAPIVKPARRSGRLVRV
jgi:hypothetical protein